MVLYQVGVCPQPADSEVHSRDTTAAPTGNVTLNELAAYVAATQLAIRLQFFGEGMKVSFIGKDVAPTPINGNNGTHGPHSEPSQPANDEQIASLESELAQLKLDKDVLETTIAKCEAVNTYLSDQLDTWRKRNGELAATLEQSVRSHEQEVGALRRQLEAAQHELAIAYRIMHVGQREQLREALLTPVQKLERAVRATGATPGPLGPVVRPRCFG